MPIAHSLSPERHCKSGSCHAAGPDLRGVPAAETSDDNVLRPGIEDLLGAGAIIGALRGSRSPEACAATAEFESFRSRLHHVLRACSSGKELIERGFDADVDLAAELDTSFSVARLAGREIRSVV